MEEAVLPAFYLAIRQAVHELVIGNYAGLAADGRAGRMTAEELRQAIDRYGRTLIDLPEEAFAKSTARAMLIEGSEAQWAVDVDLWTVEEGASDLTLQMIIRETSDGVSLEMTDLHVL